MKRNLLLTTTLATLMTLPAAWASDAQTSATAGSNRYNPTGTAGATASYDGRVGFARTDANSGPVSTARGVAVGVDEDGISLSVSNAVAPRFGSAIATTFNLSIGRDGEVSSGLGLSVADGPISRSATAGGQASTGRNGNSATALAGGQTDRYGRVHATTDTNQYRPDRVVRVSRPTTRVVHRSAPSEVRRVIRVRR